MSIFKKEAPRACPKCGKADGWRALPEETYGGGNAAAAVNPFSPTPIRNTFGQNLSGAAGGRSKKIRFHCQNCGYEKTY